MNSMYTNNQILDWIMMVLITIVKRSREIFHIIDNIKKGNSEGEAIYSKWCKSKISMQE